MRKFKIEVQEFLSRIVEIEVNSSDEAISKAWEMYRKEELVLDYSDHVATEINVFPEQHIIDLNYLSNENN